MSESNEQVASILGEDPVSAETVPSPAPVAKAEEPVVTPKGVERNPKDEQAFLAMKEKAGLFEIIQNDPELHSTVINYIDRKNKQSGKAPQAAQPDPNSDIAAIKEQNQKLQEMVQLIAAREAIREFKEKTPDFEQYRPAMAQLLEKHKSLSIEEAYEFAKGTTKKAPNEGQQPSQARLKTPETRGNGPSDNADLESYIKRINDPKATPRTDDYIDLAFKAATAKYNAESGN